MDERHFEKAAELEQAMRDDAMNAVRRAVNRASERPEDFDGSCPSCGELIPEARVSAGYFICVPCKERSEYISKQHVRGQQDG